MDPRVDTTASPPLRTGAFIALMCSLVSIGGISVTLILPSMPSMVIDLGSSAAGVQLTLGVFMIAFGVAQLVWGPLSDRYGRRPTLRLGLGLYVLASVCCWASATIELLIVSRALQAIGACCAPVVARAVVRDVYDREDMARIMSYVILAFAVSGILAPSFGAFIQENAGWRGNFAFMALVGAVLLAIILTVLPETHPASRREPSNARHVIRNYCVLLSNRQHLGYALAGSLSYSAYFVFSSIAAFALIEVANVSPTLFALLYAAVAFGYGIGTFTSARLARRLGLDRTVAIGLAVSVLASLLHNVLVLDNSSNPYTIALPMVIVALGLGLGFANLQAGAIAPFPVFAGAASSTAGFLQMLVSSVIGAIALQFYNGTPLVMSAGILFSAAGMAGVYYILVWRRINETE